MKKKIKVSLMLEYELNYFSRFLNDFVSEKKYSDVVVTDSLYVDSDDVSLTTVNEYRFLNSYCYQIFNNDGMKFSDVFLSSGREYGKIEFCAACEFISILRNNLSCRIHDIVDGVKVDSDVFTSTVYERSLCLEQSSYLKIVGHVHFECYDVN